MDCIDKHEGFFLILFSGIFIIGVGVTTGIFMATVPVTYNPITKETNIPDETHSVTVNVTGCFTRTANLTFRKRGNKVTLIIPRILGTTTAADGLIMEEAIPEGYRPFASEGSGASSTDGFHHPVIVKVGSTVTALGIFMTSFTDGTIIIFPVSVDPDPLYPSADVFPDATSSCGVLKTQISYYTV